MPAKLDTSTDVLIDAYLSGMSLSQVAARYGFSGGSGVYNRMRRAGFVGFRKDQAGRPKGEHKRRKAVSPRNRSSTYS